MDSQVKALKPIRILHVIKSLGRGGAEMLLPETLKLHDRSKYQFHYVFFLPWKDQLVKALSDQDVAVKCLSAKGNIGMIFQLPGLMRYIKDNQIELIHAHLPWAGVMARLAGAWARVPVIYTEHNKQERYQFVTRFFNLSTMNMLTKVIAVSKDVEESIYKHKPKIRVPVLALLNGVNTEHFKRNHYSAKSIRELLHIPEQCVVIGTVAVFRSQKRLQIWLKIASKIISGNKNVHFVLVGDGPEKESLLTLRSSLGLDHHVHMPGLQADVRPYLASFDIYMMSSIFEGLPVALLEAMSMECAVISTAAGGIAEVVQSERDGLLCPVDQPEKLSDLVTLLLDNADLRKRYGSNARERVTRHFDLKLMVGQLENMYNEIASAKGQKC